MRLAFPGLLFIGFTFIEIAGFILVGDAIGVLATLALIVLSAMLGIYILRRQKQLLFTQMQKATPDQFQYNIASGTATLLAGILLIIPGFFTDIIGLLLLIPAVQSLLKNHIGRYSTMGGSFRFGGSYSKPNNSNDKTIDLDSDDYHSETSDDSPWKSNGDNKKLPPQ